jgi:AcrR family transcriptional regulator
LAKDPTMASSTQPAQPRPPSARDVAADTPGSDPAKGRRPKRVGARDRILAAAVELFYREGIRTTGIDRVIAEAGVAKASFYEHFETKDALVAAYVQARSAAFEAWFHAWIIDRFGTAEAATPADAQLRLLAIIDAIAEFASSPEFCGCAFIGVVEQIDDASHPARQAAEHHREKVRSELVTLATIAGATDSQQLGLALSMLADGLLIAARAAATPDQRQLALKATRAAWTAVVRASLDGRPNQSITK